LSRPIHGRMARFDGFCIGPTEEPQLMTRRVAVKMMECLNCMTTSFIICGSVSSRCEGEIKRR
jgi:hypothetical protein